MKRLSFISSIINVFLIIVEFDEFFPHVEATIMRIEKSKQTKPIVNQITAV